MGKVWASLRSSVEGWLRRRSSRSLVVLFLVGGILLFIGYAGIQDAQQHRDTTRTVALAALALAGFVVMFVFGRTQARRMTPEAWNWMYYPGVLVPPVFIWAVTETFDITVSVIAPLALIALVICTVGLLVTPRWGGGPVAWRGAAYLVSGLMWLALAYYYGSLPSFHGISSPNGQDILVFQRNSTAPVSLTWQQAMYLAVALASTAATGDITPANDAARLFVGAESAIILVLVVWVLGLASTLRTQKGPDEEAHHDTKPGHDGGENDGVGAEERRKQVHTPLLAPLSLEPPAAGTSPEDEKDVLRQVLSAATDLYNGEQDRTRTIETKAAALVTVLGVVAVFTVNAAGLLLSSTVTSTTTSTSALGHAPGVIRIVVVVLYVVIAVAFGAALWNAIRALSVGYWARPHPEDLGEMSRQSPTAAMRLYIKDLYVSLESNFRRNNELAPYVHRGQIAMLVGALMLVFLALLLAGIWAVG